MDTKSLIIGGIAGICLVGYFCNKDKKETVVHKTTVIEKEVPSPAPTFKQQNRDYFEDIEEYVPPVQKIRVQKQRVAPTPIIIQQPSVQYIPDTRYVGIPYCPPVRHYYHPPVHHFHHYPNHYHHHFPRGPRHFCPPRPIHHHNFRHHFRNFHNRPRCW